MYCQFKRINSNQVQCETCNKIIKTQHEKVTAKCKGKLEGPSLAQKATNFGKAIIKHTVDAGKNVSEEEYQKRISVCKTCEFFKDMRCLNKGCGCFLEVKARWASESCPIGKWKDNN